MADVTGTWLLKGTGRTLAIVRTAPGVGAYVIDDDGDGQVDPDQRGTVTVRPDGGLCFARQGVRRRIATRCTRESSPRGPRSRRTSLGPAAAG